MGKLPDFEYENGLWNEGRNLVGGCDEVGRGCFAGPVVAAAVVFDTFKGHALQDSRTIRIDDSKKLTSIQREGASAWIKQNSLAWGVGEASTSFINKFGIVKATNFAFRRAIAQTKDKLGVPLDSLLIDAFYIPYIRGVRRKNQLAIVKGDTKSFSIAAASIVAKVYRDKLMIDLDEKSEAKYKPYLWHKNKGYGTKEHQTAILKHGVTPYHRRMFVTTFLTKSQRLRTNDEINSFFSSQVRLKT